MEVVKMGKINIMIVDDQTIMRDGLKTILELDDDIEVVAAVSNGKEAVKAATEFKPDIILMDIRMPEMNGVDATRIIKKEYPHIIIIILTTFDDDDYIIQAMANGAAGYLLKDIDGEKLIQAVHDGISGNIIMPGRVAAKLAARLSNSNQVMENKKSKLEQFTERELDIIRLMIAGESNKKIASLLYLTEGTVKNYISGIYSKIYVKDRANAILYFKNLGL